MKQTTESDLYNFYGMAFAFTIFIIILFVCPAASSYYPFRLNGTMVGYSGDYNSTNTTMFNQYTLMNNIYYLYTDQLASTIDIQLTAECKYDDQSMDSILYINMEVVLSIMLLLVMYMTIKDFDRLVGFQFCVFVMFWTLSIVIDVTAFFLGYESINEHNYQQIYAIKGSLSGNITSKTYKFDNQYAFIETLCNLKYYQPDTSYWLKIDEYYELFNAYLPVIIMFRILALIVLISANITLCQYHCKTVLSDYDDTVINESSTLTNNQ